MRKLIVAIALVLLVFVGAKAVKADEQVCTTVYGGGVVCGVSTEHKPVETALGDINPAILGGGLMLASYAFHKLSRKVRSSIAL